MTAWWYWLTFTIVFAVTVGVPTVIWWERRQDERDKQLWDEIHGGQRPW